MQCNVSSLDFVGSNPSWLAKMSARAGSQAFAFLHIFNDGQGSLIGAYRQGVL